MSASSPVAAGPPRELDSFRNYARAFVEREIAPFVTEWERNAVLPASLFREAGRAGLLGLVVPPHLGGAGLDLRFSIAFAEELMRADAASAAVSLLLVANTVLPMLVRHASPELQLRLGPPIARGEVIAAMAVTEPDGGSDLIGAIHTTAETDGDHWIVNGEKMFITNGPIAGVFFVLARAPEAAGPLSMSMIAVPRSTPGCHLVRRFDKLGLHASPTGWMRFERCRVPKCFTVGKPGNGYLYFSDAIAAERVVLAAASIAYALRCVERTSEYLRGQDPARYNVTAREQLFAITSELESCRAFVCRSVREAVATGRMAATDAYMAKFALCEAAQRAVQQCVELHRSRFPLDGSDWLVRAALDSRVLSIFAGTSETMRDLFSQALGRERRLESIRSGA
jgi:long-chain-acyl-CoA dehydrogenase